MNLTWLVRMARWARRPPSTGRVILVFSVVAICLLIAGAEWLGLVPDWAGLEPGRRMPRVQPLE